MRDALESWWVTLARRTRALEASVPAICVGGATLGGTGKTPLAIAIAKRLAAGGARVALVGHAYRAAPGRARVVAPDDPLAKVGDEALVCARALAGIARVVVAPRRQAAMDLAARLADVMVVDGVLQLRPRRAALSILTIHTAAPRALAAVADVVTPVTTKMTCSIPWSALREEPVGLVTCLARPRRVLEALARVGVVPVAHVALPDHGPRARAPRLSPNVRWLATEKCALHLHAITPTTLTCEAELPTQLDQPLRAPYSPSTSHFSALSA